MLSYQHQFHAGNHADVLKHWLLIECVNYLKKKTKPFDYIDTHAGAGLYLLDSLEAKKTQEAENGVLKLNFEQVNGLESYQLQTGNYLEKNQYPGSPMIVNDMLREGDHSWLYELHPQTIEELRAHCERKRMTYVKQQDGFEALPGLLPTKSRRALVLIDPSYEIKTDYQRVVKLISVAYQRAPNTVFLLWYPVVQRYLIDELEKDFINSDVRNVVLFEMGVAEDAEKGMTASGIIAVNPPWTLAEKFNKVFPAVSQRLSVDGRARVRSLQLTGE